MESTMNDTMIILDPYNTHRMSDYEILTWGFVFIPMIAISDVSNLIVIWIILSHKSMRKVTNYFIVNLSLADILITTFNVPINYFYMTHGNFPFGEIYCVFWNAIAVASMTSSVFTLTAIAFDRYRAILYPLEPRFSRFTSLTAIAVIWVLAILISFPYITYSKTTQDHFLDGDKATYCTAQWPDGRMGESRIEFLYNTGILIFVYAIPMLVIATLYYRVGNELERSHPVGERVDTKLAHRYTERKKIIRMLRTVVVFFAICWLPYHVYFLLIPFFPQIAQQTISVHGFLVIYLLAMSNSMFNPIIYVWMNNSFRRGFRNFLLCRCSRGIYSSDPSELDRTIVTSVTHSNKKIGYVKSKHHKHSDCTARANGRSHCTCHRAIESSATGTSSPSKGFNVASGSSYVTNTPNGSQGGNLNSSASSPSPAAVTFALNDTSGQAKVSTTHDTIKREQNNSSFLSSNLQIGDLSPPSSFCSSSSLINSSTNLDHLLMVSFDKVSNKCVNRKRYLPQHRATVTDTLADRSIEQSHKRASTTVAVSHSSSHTEKCPCHTDNVVKGEEAPSSQSILSAIKSDTLSSTQCAAPIKCDAESDLKHDQMKKGPTHSVDLQSESSSSLFKKSKKSKMNEKVTGTMDARSTESTVCENLYREEDESYCSDGDYVHTDDPSSQTKIQVTAEKVSFREISSSEQSQASIIKPIVISNSCILVNDEVTCVTTRLPSDTVTSPTTVSSVSTITAKGEQDAKLSFAAPSLSSVIPSDHHLPHISINQCSSLSSPLRCNDCASTEASGGSQKCGPSKKSKNKLKKSTTARRLASLMRLNLTRSRGQRADESTSSGGGGGGDASNSATSTTTAPLASSTSGCFHSASPSVSDCAISSV